MCEKETHIKVWRNEKFFYMREMKSECCDDIHKGMSIEKYFKFIFTTNHFLVGNNKCDKCK